MKPRLKIWQLAALFVVICLIGLDSSCNRTSTPGRAVASFDVEVLQQMTAFVGGKFEASGVAAVPGSDGVLFVDNNQAGQVFWMRLDQDGKQAGAIKPIELGINIGDLKVLQRTEHTSTSSVLTPIRRLMLPRGLLGLSSTHKVSS